MEFLDKTGVQTLWNKIKGGFLALTGGNVTGSVTIWDDYQENRLYLKPNEIELLNDMGSNYGLSIINQDTTHQYIQTHHESSQQPEHALMLYGPIISCTGNATSGNLDTDHALGLFLLNYYQGTSKTNTTVLCWGFVNPSSAMGGMGSQPNYLCMSHRSETDPNTVWVSLFIMGGWDERFGGDHGELFLTLDTGAITWYNH